MRRLAGIFVFILLLAAMPGSAADASIDAEVQIKSSIDTTVGEQFALLVNVTNNFNEEKDVSLTGFATGSVTFSARTVRLKANETKSEAIFGTAHTAGSHAIRIMVDGMPMGSEILVRAERAPAEPVPPANQADANAPLLSVSGVTFLPVNPHPEEPFTLHINVQNAGNAEARSVEATLDGGNNFEVLSLTNKTVFANIPTGTTRTAAYQIRAKKTRESNHVTLTFTYFSDGRQETSSVILNLPLGRVEEPPPPPAEGAPFLKIGAFKVEPLGNRDFNLRFQVHNTGRAAARQVSVRFEGTQAFPRGSSNVIYFDNLESGRTRDVVMRMGVAGADEAVFLIPVTLSYFSKDAAEFSGSETLAVTAAELGLERVAEPQKAGTPRVFLSKYTLSQERILAGNTVKLTLHIENSSDREVGNIKISLGVVPMEGNASGTVFSPVNSSNSFYIARIAGKRTIVKTVDLYVDPNAAARTYLVPVEIVYEDGNGNSYDVSEMVNIPVTQESRLQVLSVEIPPNGIIGQPLSVTAEFVNIGKVALKNFLVSIEGDFLKENATSFVANFEVGAGDYFQGMIIPQAEGLLSGKVVFTYTDNANREVRIEHPFEVQVQAGGPGGPAEPGDPGFPPGEMPTGRQKTGLIWLLPGMVLLSGGIFLGLRKLRAKRGDLFDEEF